MSFNIHMIKWHTSLDWNQLYILIDVTVDLWEIDQMSIDFMKNILFLII
jgi:hypothetical protein